MQSLWLPGWLYRLLPLIYLVGGILMFYLFGDSVFGRLSAIFLCAASILIWGLRLYVRKEASRQQP